MRAFSRISRRRVLALAGAPLPACAFADGADLPAKPLRILSTSAPGGNIDVLTRIVADALALRLKQPVIVDNRPGASGILGTQEFAAHYEADFPRWAALIRASGARAE